MPWVPLPAIEGWSLSNRADADWESMEDWVAKAAKEDVDSWYLDSPCRVRVRTRLGCKKFTNEGELFPLTV